MTTISPTKPTTESATQTHPRQLPTDAAHVLWQMLVEARERKHEEAA